MSSKDEKTVNSSNAAEEEKKKAQQQQQQQEEKINALIEAIEEDDDFEEFHPCNWNKDAEDVEDLQQWQVSLSQAVLPCTFWMYNYIHYLDDTRALPTLFLHQNNLFHTT